MDNLQTSGRIFDIQRFSLHDGQGIRTIVFLKGCPLRCKWCCNPESQNYDFETMITDGASTATGRDITVAQVMEIVERDRHYYRRSGGGLTLSGGEALAQPKFATALLQTAQENGIPTAIETTAMVDYSVIQTALPYIDEFLMDIKHLDGAKHQEFTGKNNALALENAKRIAKTGANLIIRVPVIPGFNMDSVCSIAQFAAQIGVKEIHLLPYHRYGEGKYSALGRNYPMGDIQPPTSAQMQELQRAVQQATALICKVGG